MRDSLTFYIYLYKLLTFEEDPCHTPFGFRKFHTMKGLLRNVWGYISKGSHSNFKEFERLGFIKKETDEKGNKSRYFIDTSQIKKFIKKNSIYSMILKRIDELDSL